MKPWTRSLIAMGVAILFVVTAYSPYSYGDTGEVPGSPVFIRVGLHYTQPALSTAVLTSAGDLALWDSENPGSFLPLTGIRQASVSLENGELIAKDSSGNSLQVLKGTETVSVSDLLKTGYSLCSGSYSEWLSTQDMEGNALVLADNKSYRGGISFFINANNTFRLVNTLTMDEYACGVINSEMGYSNPMEALKAQAVVVRSYGLTNMDRHSSSGYDVCDSTHCQVYKGYSQENPKTNLAIKETSKLGLYHNGQPATGYFYKNSGGYTQKAEDVWNSPVGYLKAVKDPYSPLYDWRVEYTLSELETKLRTAGYRTGPLTSVTVTEYNESGAVASLTFKGSESTVSLSKEKIRSVLGMTQIKSTHFTLSGGQSLASQAWVVQGKTSISRLDNRTHVLGAAGAKAQVELGDKYGISQSGVKKLGTYTEEITGDSLRFEGKGYGHGVGMPQDSAIAMAKEGATFQDILKFYYYNIEIK